MEIFYKKITDSGGVCLYVLYLKYNRYPPKELCYTYSESKANWLVAVLNAGLRF